jgi:hypothetical protein
LSTELTTTGFPNYQWRVHYGNRKILRDGGDVEPPYFARISPARLAGLVLEEAQRTMLNVSHGEKNAKTNVSASRAPLSYRIYSGLCDASRVKHFTVWHTGYARNPKSLMSKWKTDIIRDLNSSGAVNKGLEKILSEGDEISYNNAYKYVWRGVKLHRLDEKEVPKILLKNRKRFTWVEFGKEHYN